MYSKRNTDKELYQDALESSEAIIIKIIDSLRQEEEV